MLELLLSLCLIDIEPGYRDSCQTHERAIAQHKNKKWMETLGVHSDAIRINNKEETPVLVVGMMAGKIRHSTKQTCKIEVWGKWVDRVMGDDCHIYIAGKPEDLEK